MCTASSRCPPVSARCSLLDWDPWAMVHSVRCTVGEWGAAALCEEQARRACGSANTKGARGRGPQATRSLEKEGAWEERAEGRGWGGMGGTAPAGTDLRSVAAP